MFRIDDPSAAVALPTPEAAGTEAYFTEGSPGTTPATLVRASWLNMLQEELRAVVVAGGLAPSKTTYNQVLTAINALIEAKAGNYYLDTGAANAYVIALSPAITVYGNGLTVSFRASHANTGASTLNAGGGAVSLLNDVGSALVSGDIPINSVVSAVYDLAANAFLIKTLVPSQVITQTQADARYAKLGGLNTQDFVAQTFKSLSGQQSAVNNTATTLFTLPTVGAGAFLVTIGFSGINLPGTYSASAIIATDGAFASITNLSTSTGMFLTLSGMNVQGRQTNGGTLNIVWSYIRIS